MEQSKLAEQMEPCTWEMAQPVLDSLVFERLSSDAVLPTYAKDGDSGMDLYAAANVLLNPQERRIIPTDLAVEFPRHILHDAGYRWGGQVRPRSGLSAKTELEVKLGTIDNTYRDGIGVIVKNGAQYQYTAGTRTETFASYDGETSEDVVIDVSLHTTPGRAVDLKGEIVEYEELRKLHEAGDLISAADNRAHAGALLIRKGDRIAQMVLEQVIRAQRIVEGTADRTINRGGGFGSTGV